MGCVPLNCGSRSATLVVFDKIFQLFVIAEYKPGQRWYFFQLRYELFKLWCTIIGALFANIKEIFIFTNENENFDDEW